MSIKESPKALRSELAACGPVDDFRITAPFRSIPVSLLFQHTNQLGLAADLKHPLSWLQHHLFVWVSSLFSVSVFLSKKGVAVKL